MYTARKKIQKDKGLEPSEFEDSVAQVSKSARPPLWPPVISFRFFELLLCVWFSPCVAVVMCRRMVLMYLQAFFDLENGNQELKSDLKDLYINGAM